MEWVTAIVIVGGVLAAFVYNQKKMERLYGGKGTSNTETFESVIPSSNTPELEKQPESQNYYKSPDEIDSTTYNPLRDRYGYGQGEEQIEEDNEKFF